MKEHLIATGEYEEYEDTLNSLALKALAICVYRSSFEKKFQQSLDMIKKSYKDYSKEFDLTKINRDVLDRNSLVILQLLKMNMFTCLIIASKIRKKRMAY